MEAGAARSRIAAANRSVRAGKTVLALGGAAAFLAGLGLVRAHVPSHHKGKASPLAAPARFTRVVRRDLLSRGIIAPAEAPPTAVTALS